MNFVVITNNQFLPHKLIRESDCTDSTHLNWKLFDYVLRLFSSPPQPETSSPNKWFKKRRPLRPPRRLPTGNFPERSRTWIINHQKQSVTGASDEEERRAVMLSFTLHIFSQQASQGQGLAGGSHVYCQPKQTTFSQQVIIMAQEKLSYYDPNVISPLLYAFFSNLILLYYNLFIVKHFSFSFCHRFLCSRHKRRGTRVK